VGSTCTEQSTLIFNNKQMKKQCMVALITLTALITNIVSVKAQSNPISGSKLSDTVCKSNFTTCSNIAESANILGVIYRNKSKTEQEAGEIAKNSLSQPGAGWDKGYQPENVSVISKQWKPDFSPVPLVDAQAIFATKIVNEGGIPKKQFMISVRGTEQLQDWLTNIAALKARDYEKGTKVGNGFLNYAYALTESPEFIKMVDEIVESAKDPNNGRYEVLISGHSLGGAAAVILKAEIENRLAAEGIPNAKEKVSAITFGAPPVGNSDFAKLYGERVIGINISGDPVPSMGLPFSTMKVGAIYEFERPNDIVAVFDNLNERGDRLGKKILDLDIIGVIGDIALFPVNTTLNIATTVAGVDTHVTGYSEDRYAAATNGWSDLRTDLMNKNLTAITIGGSSPIGSASYYLGQSPNQDPKIELGGIKKESLQEREQYTTPAGSITNLVAPVDVVLNWNQSFAAGQLDLDSHLTGPAGLGDDSSVRFHTFFESKGSSTTAPYVLLYRDVIPPISSLNKDEQTRIQVLQNGVYRFYVHDYTNRDQINSTALSQSEANVKVFNGGQNIPTEGENLGTQLGNAIKVPTNQQGNVWRAFELDSRTGVLKPVLNAPFGNVSTPSSVPSVGQNPVNNGGGSVVK
jgi:Lipase (class 3)